MEKYDYIIIGAGMGGLSVANFLAKYHKKVLVLEKHNIPGGLVTSFARKGTHFDLGIHGLYELKEGQSIPQFLEFWNAPQIETLPCQGDMVCFIDGKKSVFRHGTIKEDFKQSFPERQKDIDRLFQVMDTIQEEMFSGTEAPEPPYDMNLFKKIRFGIQSSRRMPVFMRYGNKDARKVLDRLTDSEELKAAIYSYSPYPMVFMAFAYQWGVFSNNQYPKEGMQSIPDAAVESLQRMGGALKLNTEVIEILVKDGKACGVRTKAGDEYQGRVISNASPQYTCQWIKTDERRVAKMKQAIAGREIFPSICALFLSMQDSYDFGGIECITIAGKQDYRLQPEEYSAENAPIVMHVYPKRSGDSYRPLVALVPLPYEFQNNWQSGGNKVWGDAYQALKNRVETVLLQRIQDHLGTEFQQAIVSHELSTPLTFERYTYSQKGSFMGWSIKEKDYGRYLKQKTAIRDLYLVGQWVFPGFGVAGVMASGYYLAKELLNQDGIDLKKEFTQFFSH